MPLCLCVYYPIHIMQNKAQIRFEIAQKKKQYPREELNRLSLRLLNQLEQHPRFQHARTVLLYYSLPDEVQTHGFVEKWSKEKDIGKRHHPARCKRGRTRTTEIYGERKPD